MGLTQFRTLKRETANCPPTVKPEIIHTHTNSEFFASLDWRTNFTLAEVSQEYYKRLKISTSRDISRNRISCELICKHKNLKYLKFGMGMNNFGLNCICC